MKISLPNIWISGETFYFSLNLKKHKQVAKHSQEHLAQSQGLFFWEEERGNLRHDSRIGS